MKEDTSDSQEIQDFAAENLAESHVHAPADTAQDTTPAPAVDEQKKEARQGKGPALSPDPATLTHDQIAALTPDQIEALMAAEIEDHMRASGSDSDASPSPALPQTDNGETSEKLAPGDAKTPSTDTPGEEDYVLPPLLDLTQEELEALAKDTEKLDKFLRIEMWRRLRRYPGVVVQKFPTSPDPELGKRTYVSTFADGMSLTKKTNDSVRDILFRMFGAPLTGADPDARDVLFDDNTSDGDKYKALYIFDGTAWRRNTLAALDLFEPVKAMVSFYKNRLDFLAVVLTGIQNAVTQYGWMPKPGETQNIFDKTREDIDAYVKALEKAHLVLEGTAFKKATLEAVYKAQNALSITGKEWDRPEDIQDKFPCKNGVIDLATGMLRPGTPRDFFLLRSDVEYKPNAKGRLWRDTVLSMMGGNEELAHYVQVVCGAAATRRTSDPLFCLLYGEGSNGKGLFLEILRAAFGELSVSCSPQLLSAAREMDANSPSPALYTLRGRALALMEEADLKGGINDAMVKTLTAGTEVACRTLYQRDNVTWRSTNALFLACNKMPRLRSLDGGTIRRILSIPFEITFLTPSSARAKGMAARQGSALPASYAWADTTLEKRLLAERELQGVLAWVVEGAQEYIRDGIPKRPGAVETQTALWIGESDMLGHFLAERVESVKLGHFTSTAPGDDRVSIAELLRAYRKWGEENGYGFVRENAQTLSRKMQTLRSKDGAPLYTSCKMHGNKAALQGLRLKPDEELPQF